MRKLTKVLTLSLALALSIGVGTTAQASKIKVKEVTSVNRWTGKKILKLAKGEDMRLRTSVKVAGGHYDVETTGEDDSKSITVRVVPKKYKRVIYKSRREKIATVSEKGMVTAKKVGKTTITVTSKVNPELKTKVKIRVVAGRVEKVSLDKKKASINVGSKLALKKNVTTVGKNPNKRLVWRSSNEKVAKVSRKGVVTGLKKGTAKITARATDGTGKKAVCRITVTKTSTPTPAPAQKTYTATVTPVDNAEVTAKVVFSDVKKAQEDIDRLAKFVTGDKEFTVNLDGQDYTATIVDNQVRINGKTLAESEKAQNAKEVTVKARIKADKVSSVVAFTPTSVASVTIDGLVFSEIKQDSFKIGTAAFTYKVNGTSLEITGSTDPQTVLKPLVDAKIVTVTSK